jgi:hypothetical protein
MLCNEGEPDDVQAVVVLVRQNVVPEKKSARQEQER